MPLHKNSPALYQSKKDKNLNNYYKVTARLLFNALRFRYFKLRSCPLKPTVVSLAVTNRCNSHCIMCNIWKSAKDIPEIKSLELSSQKIISILSSPLFAEIVELDLTGGEPHLRDDMVDIVLGIIRLKKSTLSKLRSIIITSNGFLTRQITSNYQKILCALNDTNIDLVSVTSIDGIGETHDRIRGTRDAFKLATETISRLSELRHEYSNLILGIKTTILPDNIDILGSILNFASSRDLFYIISPVLFTEARFRNMDMRDDLMLEPAGYKKVIDFYSRDEFKTSYFYSMAHSFLAAGHKQWACAALYNYLFIDFDGKVYSCEIIPEPIGNVKKQDILDIWNSPQAHHWRKRIGKLECCHTCHEPGAIRYSAFTEGISYLKFLMNLGRHEFDESWHGEGFSKYFSAEIKQ
jgi:MoaA/NifB/PqqE/SkfB family radical SAM enzyme